MARKKKLTVEVFQMGLAELLLDLRQKKGLTQAEAAEQAGITRQHFQRLEAGITNPSVGTLIGVAGVFGLGLDELVSKVKRAAA